MQATLATAKEVVTSKRILPNVALFLVLGFAAIFIWRSNHLTQSQVWFANMDQDSTLLMDSLRVNAGREPYFLEHPGLGNYVLYGLGLRILKASGTVAFDNFDQLFSSDDPIVALPSIYYGGWKISQALAIVIACVIGTGVLILGGSLLNGAILTCLALSCYGLLFQSLLVRTELASVFFASIGFVCLCLSTRSARQPLEWASICAAGFFLGCSVLTKMVMVPILAPSILFLAFSEQRTLKSASNESTRKNRRAALVLTSFAAALCAMYFLAYLPKDVFTGTHLLKFLYVWFLSFPVVALIKNQKISAKLLNIWTFVFGYLAAVPVLFYICNVRSVWAQNLVISGAYSIGKMRSPVYVSTSRGNYEMMFSHFGRFLTYSSTTSPLLPLAFLLALFLKGRAKWASLLLIASGLGMSAVMSFRYFGQHYTIYPDFFYIASIGTSSVSVWQRFMSPQTLRIRSALFGGVLVLLLAYGAQNFRYGEREYPKFAETVRNQIESIPTGVWVEPEYAEKMRSRYGTPEQIMRRVVTDHRLNGIDRGIDISTMSNFREQIDKLN